MWRSLVARLLWEQDVAGSNPVIPTIFISTCGCSSMVELQPSKLVTRVRFPSPAPANIEAMADRHCFFVSRGIRESNLMQLFSEITSMIAWNLSLCTDLIIVLALFMYNSLFDYEKTCSDNINQNMVATI